MPLYTYTCPHCGHVDDNVVVSVSKRDEKRLCKQCEKEMERNFPLSAHTVVEGSVDSKDVGAVIKQKNEALKAREAGYSHESKNVRRDIESKTQKIKENRQ